ncbi:MAG: glycosyltransferase family 4 protein [Vicingaceae bacterium]
MPKALIITYYWPPAGGGGVQRWLKFVRYMRDYGWEPVIFTPLNPEFSNFDESLLDEIPEGLRVIKTSIWEPFNAYKRIIGRKSEEKIQPGFLQESNANSLLQKISVWIRGNLFIPDAKRFWIRPSERNIIRYLKNNKIDVLISTGPPHSNHLIARNVKRATGIKWLADFRDPWTNIDYYEKLKLTRMADRSHHSLERSVLKEADKVITVSWSWAHDFQEKTGVRPEVITNGFDPEDFKSVKSTSENAELIILHIGSLNADRNPHAFWKALSEINANANRGRKIRVKLIGPTDISVFKEIEAFGLYKCIEHIPHLPHKEVITHLFNADVLLLPLNNTPNINGVIPGKLYEYLAAKKTILAIGSTTGDSAKILKETGSGCIFEFNDSSGIAKFLSNELLGDQNHYPVYNEEATKKYSRVELTAVLCKMLEDMIT